MSAMVTELTGIVKTQLAHGVCQVCKHWARLHYDNGCNWEACGCLDAREDVDAGNIARTIETWLAGGG